MVYVKQQKKNVTEEFKYQEGKEKPCLQCKELFLPVGEYRKRLFCCEKCEGDFVKAALDKVYPPEFSTAGIRIRPGGTEKNYEAWRRRKERMKEKEGLAKAAKA